jgi:N-acetyl-beta-hexosaminidase
LAPLLSYEHHATINLADPKVLQAVETIVGEMCDVFQSSPYFHIGGDEADFAFAHQHPDLQAAFKRFNLGEKGQWQLYRRLLLQMSEIVKRRGRQMIVWEGFHRDRESQFQIPKDVTVMEYECPFYPPRHLIEDGYTMINAAWTPLYVVNRKRWTPEQIYAWNLYLLGQHSTNYATTPWHQLEPTPQIIGAQMCSWEQPQAMEISSLRTRLPAISERIWNPGAARSYDDYARRAAATDRLLSRVIPTVRIKADGLAEPDHNMNDVPVFDTKLKVSIESELPAAEIRYTLDGQMPVSSVAAMEPSEPGSSLARRAANSLTYTVPLEIAVTTTITAAAFDAEGNPVGHAAAEVFYHQE